MKKFRKTVTEKITGRKSAAKPPAMNPVDIFMGMDACRILVVGDVMLDRFIAGNVSRISPEAPVPVLRRTHEADMPGGAANVARNLSHLGAKTILIGVTGTGPNADALKAAIAAEPNISFTPIQLADRRTTLKTRFSTAGQQMLRMDDEEDSDLATKVVHKIIALVERHIARCNLVVLSDYDKGVLDADTVRAIIRIARAAKKPVLVDPKKTDMAIWRGADMITPNLVEAHAMLGIEDTPLHTGDGGDRDAYTGKMARAMAALCRKHEIASALVTLGADGMLLLRRGAGMGAKPLHLAASARQVFDVSGAGDTVIAMLAAAMAAGASPEEAGRIANTAAGIVVGKPGTATASPGEVLAELVPPPEITRDGMLTQIARWHYESRRIGFTNGCFDLLHPGHIALLAKAAKHCERLVVGLNGDASVRALKGAPRPYIPAERRAAVLAALPMVDAVITFDEPTPAALIDRIKPQRLIKGGDYKMKDIVGAKEIRKLGGKVVILPLVAGYSTTRIAGQLGEAVR